jgi:branched-chain amino acid transport system ATP-binding protein
VSLLDVRGLTKRFGGVVALDDLDFAVAQGEIVALVGPNGAGKTTVFNCVGGLYRPDAGTVRFAGEDVTGLRADRVCRRGLVRTFQLVRVFPTLTVEDNCVVAALSRVASVELARARARPHIDRLGLGPKRSWLPGQLTVAEKKRLEFCRALATEPTMLLLDEVMSGLTPVETAEAVALVRKVRDSGVTVLLVEHIMDVVVQLADRIVVLDSGRKLAEGPPRDVLQVAAVIEAYLGEGYAHD